MRLKGLECIIAEIWVKYLSCQVQFLLRAQAPYRYMIISANWDFCEFCSKESGTSFLRWGASQSSVTPRIQFSYWVNCGIAVGEAFIFWEMYHAWAWSGFLLLSVCSARQLPTVKPIKVASVTLFAGSSSQVPTNTHIHHVLFSYPFKLSQARPNRISHSVPQRDKHKRRQTTVKVNSACY